MVSNDHSLFLFYVVSILAWCQPDVHPGSLHSFAMKILFTLAGRDGLDLRKEALQQFSQIDWRQLAVLGVGPFETVNLQAFVAKVGILSHGFGK